MTPRLAIVSVVLVTVAIPAWHALGRMWIALMMAWGSYTLVFTWLDQAILLLLALHLLLCAALGFTVVFLAKPVRPLITGTVVGIVFEIALNFLSKDWWAPEYRYGLYATAPLGAFVGAKIAVWVQGLRHAAAI